ncbi:cbb3-type cytochrome c oxidase subunit 3 [Pseudomonas sp.]|uniref:cbb3-type cytochrome c oxidase subunit 3 n=1 Tax=Pseudomonas sp. TaxID=306 RepID=UPI003F32DBAD
MTEIVLNLFGVVGFWLVIEYCLKHQTAESLEEASLMPFADDPEVARRVELATGKSVKAVAPEETKPGWGDLEV